uniref:Hamartin n=1 Tax=Elaeophora elaphi TaxID=1147741 RepID=A0A0R3RW98_9BILA
MKRKERSVAQLIRYAESLDSKVSEDSLEALQGLINQGEGISQMVTCYIQNRSPLAVELLCNVKEPYDTATLKLLQELCNRIQDSLSKNTLPLLTLLGQLIQKTPSWLPKLAEHSLFDHILKFIRPSENVVVVVSAILLVSSLLPHFAAPKKSILLNLFRILIVACNMLYNFKKLFDQQKTDIIEGIYVSHLYSAVIQYFIVLYGIYPATLVEYLRNHINVVDGRAIHVLKALFSAVKFHPNILNSTVEQELDRNRWNQRETHDFLADCRRVLVRPVLPAVVKVGKLISSNHTLETSSSSMSYVSQLPDLNDLFPQIDSSSSNSLGTSLDHWNEDDAWLECGRSDSDIFPDSRSGSLDNRVSDNRWEYLHFSCKESSTRRATAGAADSNQMRRSSLTQKFNDFIRKRKSRTLSDESLLHSLPVPRTLMLAAKDGTIGNEPIEEIFVREEIRKRNDENGHIEEGVDAREICSPSIPFSSVQPAEDSFANTPATIVPLENMHQPQSESLAPSGTFGNREIDIFSSTNSATSTSVVKTFHQSIDTDDNAETIRYRKVKDFKVNEAEEPAGSISNESANRFSVTSFFRKVNCQRFISGCCHKKNEVIHFLGHAENFSQTQLLRTFSCPDLLNVSELDDKEKMYILNDLKQRQFVTARNTELSVEDIEELIAQKCPYLPFLQALPFSLVDEENLNEELKCEHDRTRQNYMEASADYHTCLKQLGLADRLPATIYDDMSEQLKDLSVETQIKVLNARLALVNQHLLYERCGRLLHAERNRRLFGRLKQQKSLESEKISLSMALHNAQVEREQLINALTDLRKRGNIERSKRGEMEKRYCETIKTYRNEADHYLALLTTLKLKMESLVESNNHRQVELEMYKRRSEDTEMKLLFTESKLEGIETLKIELRNAHQTNQQLRDEVSLLQKRLEEESFRSTSRIRSLELDTSQMMAEVVRLKSLLIQEEKAKESARAKARKFEDDLMIERRRCTEFNAFFERAKKLHSQQCEAAQHKYLSLLSVCQKQQSHILDLYARIEEIVALPNPEGLVNIESRMLFPRSSLSEMYFSSGSSQGSSFPSELFDDENENNKDDSDVFVRNSDTVVSLFKSDPKGGVLSLSS